MQVVGPSRKSRRLSQSRTRPAVRTELPTFDSSTKIKSMRRCDLFFFSSRRRHTRFDCDWSSDVCSSDLDLTGADEKVTCTPQKQETVVSFSPKPYVTYRSHFEAGDVPDQDGKTKHTALTDRKSTRLNSSHSQISYAVFCLKKKKTTRC